MRRGSTLLRRRSALLRRGSARLRQSIQCLGAVSLAVSLAACVARPRTVEPGVPPELKHSWELSFNQGNAKAVADLYAPDAQLVMSGAPPVRGRADIRRAVGEMIKTGVKAHIDVETNVGAGDIAYVYGSYTISDGKAGRETERGSYVEVWRRRDGAWAIVLDVNAVGEPLPPIGN
jgi:uncharacterized protein (TIGR02246 family)